MRPASACARLAHEPVQQRGVGGELAGGVDPRLRRDVGRVDRDLAVGATLDDADDAESREPVAGVAGPQQAQIERCRLHRLRFVGGVGVVAQLLVDDPPTRRVAVAVGGAIAHLGHAFAQQRHGEHDELVLAVGRHVERHGRCVELRHRERRAVGQDAARPLDGDATECERRLVDDELEEAPGVRARGAQPHVEHVRCVPRFLLEVLRQQEHALRPDDLAVQAHPGISLERGPATWPPRLRPPSPRRGS
jgi:hypothetical protein